MRRPSSVKATITNPFAAFVEPGDAARQRAEHLDQRERNSVIESYKDGPVDITFTGYAGKWDVSAYRWGELVIAVESLEAARPHWYADVQVRCWVAGGVYVHCRTSVGDHIGMGLSARNLPGPYIVRFDEGEVPDAVEVLIDHVRAVAGPAVTPTPVTTLLRTTVSSRWRR